MLKKDQLRKKYPSDLTDEPWAIVEPLIPPAKQRPRGGHPRTVDRREVLNTICNYPGRLRVPMQSAFTALLRKG
jgi:hypothetical protein